MQYSTKLTISRLLVTAAALYAGTTWAAVTTPKEGKYDDIICYAGPVHSTSPVKGQLGMSLDLLGTTGVKEGDIFSNTSGHCVGAFTLIGEDGHAYGSCSFTDSDGDAFFGTYALNNMKEKGTWKVTGGTGKYDGMQQSGDWKPITQIPSPAGMLQECDRITGAWKMR